MEIEWGEDSGVECYRDSAVGARVLGRGDYWRRTSAIVFGADSSGVQSSVYNVKERTWLAPSELVDDIDQGKDRAEIYATAYLRRVANSELPPLNWKKSRSA